MADMIHDASSEPTTGDAILLSLVALIVQCEGSGDPETLLHLHGALHSRCDVLEVSYAGVSHRLLAMDPDLDMPGPD